MNDAIRKYMSAMGRKARGVPKHFSAEEIARRTARLRKAKRWPKKANRGPKKAPKGA